MRLFDTTRRTLRSLALPALLVVGIAILVGVVTLAHTLDAGS